MSLIIYGPQGCGKTRNAQRLAAHFGLTHILDDDEEWNEQRPLPADTLVLTNQEGIPGALNFHQVMALIDGGEA